MGVTDEKIIPVTKLVPFETILRMGNPETQIHGWSFSDKLAFAFFCLAAVMAIVLYWIDKTPVAAGISIASMAALMIYPILHFMRKPKSRVVAFLLVAFSIAGFGWEIWPVKAHTAQATQPQTDTAKRESSQQQLPEVKTQQLINT